MKMINKVLVGKFTEKIEGSVLVKYVIDEKTMVEIDAYIDGEYAIDLDTGHKIYVLKRNEHDGRLKSSEKGKIELNKYYALRVRSYDYSNIGTLQLLLLKYKARVAAKEPIKVKKINPKR